MKTETIKHKDVRGKELLYICITNEKTNQMVLINVGQKTFDNLNKIMEEIEVTKEETEEKLKETLGDKLENAEEKLKKDIKK